MKLIDYCIRQPITVAVGVGMALLAGVMALTSVPVQMKPDVDSVVIAVQHSGKVLLQRKSKVIS